MSSIIACKAWGGSDVLLQLEEEGFVGICPFSEGNGVVLVSADDGS